MKYWSELIKFEGRFIELNMAVGLVKVITSALENHVDTKDVQNSLYLLQDIIEKFHKNLVDDFDILWKTIREDDEMKERNEEKKYDFEPLDNVMKTWIEP